MAVADRNGTYRLGEAARPRNGIHGSGTHGSGSHGGDWPGPYRKVMDWQHRPGEERTGLERNVLARLVLDRQQWIVLGWRCEASRGAALSGKAATAWNVTARP